jgi:hypothetical protein
MDHFVPSTRVEVVENIADACVAIALDKDTDSFKLLPDRILAT